MMRRTLFFVLLAACLVLATRVGERHALQFDLSAQRVNSLSATAARALDALPGGLQITAFIPDYAVQRAQIDRLLAPYLAHGGGIHLDFIDPVREPALTRERGVSRHGEIHLSSGQRREVVATPDRAALDRALNRLALRGERWIVSLKGHGENPLDDSPAGIGRFVAHLEGLGYRVVALDPRQLDALPENTAALLVAAPQQPYDARSLALIEGFLGDGGALLWLGTQALPGSLTEALGVNVLPGTVVDAAAARYRMDSPDNAIVAELPAQLVGGAQAGHAVFRQARAFALDPRPDWRVEARLESSPQSWNETGDLRGQIARDAQLGEQPGPLTVGVALARTHDTGRQALVLVGSEHLISNDQLGAGANMALAVGMLRWLTDNETLADAAPPADLDIRWSPRLAGWLAVSLMGLAPLLYLATGLWLRARRRRA